jgi:hypothetical protein
MIPLLLLLACGQALAATQAIQNGDVAGSLRVSVYDTGQMAVHRYDGSNWVNQTYGPNSKFSFLFVDNTLYTTGYSGFPFWTLVSNQATDNSYIVSVFGLPGTGITVTQTVTLFSAPNYRIRWDIRNDNTVATGALRFTHGEDTYFSGSDEGEGHYDNVLKMVYVTNTTDGATGLMGFYASTATPFDRYFEGDYSDNYDRMATWTQDNTVDPAYIDCGYSLGWTHAALAPGQTWSIIAYEKITQAVGTIQVISPSERNGLGGESIDYTFTVRNLGDAEATYDLVATSEHGWTTVLDNSTVTIPAGGEANVVVRVTIPGGTADGVTDLLTLTASEAEGDTASDGTITTVGALVIDAPVLPPTVIDVNRNVVGGGCSTAPGRSTGNSLFLLAIPAIALLVRRLRARRAARLLSIVAVFALVAMLSSAAVAANLVPKAQRFKPTPDGLGAVTLDSDQTVGEGRASVSLFANGSKRPLNRGNGQDLQVRGEIVHDLATFDLAAAYGVSKDLELTIDVPVNWLVNGVKPGETTETSNVDWGDIRAAAKWRIASGQRWGVAAVPFFNFATGNRDRLLSEGHNAIGAKLVGRFDVTPSLSLVANVGGEKPGDPTKRAGSPACYSAWFQYGAGAIYKIDAANAVVAEINGETVWAHPFDRQVESPMEALLAYRRGLGKNLTLNVGGGEGINKGIGAPQWRAFLGVTWAN